jgi:hypothetical protein
MLAKDATTDTCLTRCADDEPVFVLVGRDRCAADTIRDWVARVTSAWKDELAKTSSQIPLETMRAVDLKLAEALNTADQMDAWRAAHGGGKLPD